MGKKKTDAVFENEDPRVAAVFRANRTKIGAMETLGFSEFTVLPNTMESNPARSWMAEVLFTNEAEGTTSFYTARGGSPAEAFARLLKLALH